MTMTASSRGKFIDIDEVILKSDDVLLVVILMIWHCWMLLLLLIFIHCYWYWSIVCYYSLSWRCWYCYSVLTQSPIQCCPIVVDGGDVVFHCWYWYPIIYLILMLLVLLIFDMLLLSYYWHCYYCWYCHCIVKWKSSDDSDVASLLLLLFNGDGDLRCCRQYLIVDIRWKCWCYSKENWYWSPHWCCHHLLLIFIIVIVLVLLCDIQYSCWLTTIVFDNQWLILLFVNHSSILLLKPIEGHYYYW